MNYLITGTAVATLLASTAIAQTTGTQTTEPQPMDQQVQTDTQAQATDTLAPGTGLAERQFVDLGDDNVLASNMIGIQVYTTPEGAAAPTEGTMASADIAGFQAVGQISDLVMGRDSSLQGIVVAGMMADTTMQEEVMIEADRLQFVVDDTVPTLWWAIVDMSPEEFQTAPLIDRMQQAAVGATAPGTGAVAGTPTATGTAPAMAPGTATGAADWRTGRTAWGAPEVGVEGFQAVPVTEMSADNLIGAQVYGVDNLSIGSIGDIVLAETGDEVSYAIIDVGGFLGIGAREVAIGFDEMTILRDAGWDELQVHVNATQETLETAPEVQR